MSTSADITVNETDFFVTHDGGDKEMVLDIVEEYVELARKVLKRKNPLVTVAMALLVSDSHNCASGFELGDAYASGYGGEHKYDLKIKNDGTVTMKHKRAWGTPDDDE